MNAFLLILSPTSYSPIPSDIRIDVAHNAKLHYFLISTKKIEEKLKEAKKKQIATGRFSVSETAFHLWQTLLEYQIKPKSKWAEERSQKHSARGGL